MRCDDGWVFAEGGEDTAEVDDFGAVESQRHDGGAPCWGEADHLQLVITPGEVLYPVLSAEMKERDELVRERIAGSEA